MVALFLTYIGSYHAVQDLLGPAMTTSLVVSTTSFMFVGIALSFCILFALHLLVVHRLRPHWLHPIRVHATNGFYIDAMYHRIFASLASASDGDQTTTRSSF